MNARRSMIFAGAAAPLIAVAIAGCGGNGGSSSGTSSSSGSGSTSAPAAPPAENGATPAVTVANRGNLGNILVDSQGRTLYLFQSDTKTASTCNGSCATAWPPLTASGTTSVGGGANQSLVGSITRSDGKQQVTYNGHPLYTFLNDSKAGDTNGQGVNAFGALWYVVSPSGNAITSSASGGSSASSGSGY